MEFNMTYIKLLFTAFFWGGTFIAGRLIADSVDPVCAAFLRFLTASVFLVFLTWKLDGCLPKITPGQALMVLALGFTGIFAYNICFFSGLRYIQANQASLIIALNPIFISFFSAVLFKEPLGKIKIAGILLSVTGALIVITKGRPLEILSLGAGRGELLIFGCVISWVTYSLLGKKAMSHLSPVTSICYSSIAGTILLFFPAVYRGLLTEMAGYSTVDWASLFYLGFFGTVLGFLWYYEGIKAIGPTKAGIFINFVPLSAICLSFFILKETLTAALIGGALCIISGVYITNAAGLKKKKQKA